MSFLKKQRAGIYVTVLALILTVAALITYQVNIAGEGYFQNAVVAQAVIYPVIALVLEILVVVLAQISLKGAAVKAIDIVSGALRIVIPVLLVIAAMNVVSSRVEGFAFIYFSNQEVLQEVQTPANMASAHGAIANIVLLGVAAVVGIVAAFFSVEKKEA